VDVVFEGSLSKSWSMKDVLLAVTEQDVRLAVLRIASKETLSAGRLAIADNQFIVGASTDAGDTGYPAVREILAIAEGSFSLLDSGNEHPSDLKDVLHLSLHKVADSLPLLPEEPGTLFDQGSLLDMLFGSKETGSISTDEPLPALSATTQSSAPPSGQDTDQAADLAVDAMQALIEKRSIEEQQELAITTPEAVPGIEERDEISDTISHPAASSPEESWNDTPVLRMALNAVIIVSLLTSLIFGWPTFIKGVQSLRMQGNEVRPPGQSS
jgi:hypothetical protein